MRFECRWSPRRLGSRRRWLRPAAGPLLRDARGGAREAAISADNSMVARGSDAGARYIHHRPRRAAELVKTELSKQMCHTYDSRFLHSREGRLVRSFPHTVPTVGSGIVYSLFAPLGSAFAPRSLRSPFRDLDFPVRSIFKRQNPVVNIAPRLVRSSRTSLGSRSHPLIRAASVVCRCVSARSGRISLAYRQRAPAWPRVGPARVARSGWPLLDSRQLGIHTHEDIEKAQYIILVRRTSVPRLSTHSQTTSSLASADQPGNGVKSVCASARDSFVARHSATRSRGLGLDEARKRAHAEAGRAARLVVPHRPRNVQMCPRRLLNKFLEEECRGDGATATRPTEVLDVGDG